MNALELILMHIAFITGFVIVITTTALLMIWPRRRRQIPKTVPEMSQSIATKQFGSQPTLRSDVAVAPTKFPPFPDLPGRTEWRPTFWRCGSGSFQ
ncbi:hypothetical protein K227x_33540 [Rubripirellula lacrimiformis]|uniref:Uncharacterized protein n=1 Tax=Rubripirellula lacrimiformis TaxID=1930273 RepID=A0A517NCX4_9BACT|nr:hypothetical protein K227x_33540 [Rubripirellula lacrimiformis]